MEKKVEALLIKGGNNQDSMVMDITKVNIKDITVGDTVIHNGCLKTVCRRAISYDSFVGVMLWGDSYNMGRKLVERVTFPRFFQGKRL